VTAFLAFLFGLILGSFLNVCIVRWPQDESVVKPRSRCPSCGKQIAWHDNIPLLSYFLLGRKCRSCGAPISWQYPVVELLNGLLFAYIFATMGLTLLAAKAALFASMMLVLAFTDYNEYILPDQITLGGLVLGVALSPFILVEPGVTRIIWLIRGETPAPWAVSLAESLAGAFFLSGVLFVMGWLYFRVRKIEGLGLGDVKMIGMIGAFWGAGTGILVLLLGSIAGSVIGLLVIAIKRTGWQHPLPFGTYLAATAIAVVLWGPQIFAWYSRVVFGAA